MKITRRNVTKGDKACYVVTRSGRRVEDINYNNRQDAIYRASLLHEMLKEWSPAEVGSVGIVYTSKPRKIY